MIYPLYSFEQLDAMEPTTRLKTLRELMRAKDPTFDNYMRRAADKVIEHYGDTQRHLEDVYQDSFEGAFVEASIHDKVRQALFAVDPTNPALDAVPPSYGVWETQRARITALETALAAMTAERDERKYTEESLADIINKLWADIILKHKPTYGDWEYTGQAYRHIVAEFDDLRKERDARDVAIGVLGDEVRAFAKDRAVGDNWLEDEVSDAVKDNPLARAAVEGER